jgi:hypothetical protein
VHVKYVTFVEVIENFRVASFGDMHLTVIQSLTCLSKRIHEHLHVHVLQLNNEAKTSVAHRV